MRKEKTLEHQTIYLNEEKLFIKEINELKAQRKQVCSNMAQRLKPVKHSIKWITLTSNIRLFFTS